MHFGRIVGGILLSVTIVSAQSVPTLINYQGRLADASGSALPSGKYGVAFRIWSKATGVPPDAQLIWGQEYDVAVVNGGFGVILGNGNPITNAAVNDLSFAFGDSERYLGLTITKGTNGVAVSNASEILPRQQLLSTPFAFRATSSGWAYALNSPNGGPTNAVFVASNGNIGVGTTNPSVLLEANGQIKAASFVGDGKLLSGVALPSSNSSLGTDFGGNTVYHNMSGHRILIIWIGQSCPSGGWGGITQAAGIGPVTPNINVGFIKYALSGNGKVIQSASFIVPDGWYWQISNSTTDGINCVGDILRIEAWELN